MKYIVGIGTNLGDKINNIRRSIQYLKKHVTIIKTSSIYESQALLKNGKYTNNDYNPYFNLAILIEYNDIPIQLLRLLKSIELKMGRNHNAIQWSARIIDLDILIAENFILYTSELIIPHINFLDRSFTIVPATEIAPEMRYGKGSFTLKELCAAHTSIKLNIVRKTY